MSVKNKQSTSKVLLTALAVLVPLLTSRTAQADQPGKSPLKVFILAGQSNMQGHGIIKIDPKRNEGKGSLEFLVKDPATAKRFKHLIDDRGQWVVRDDVWIWYLHRKGGLTVGYGARKEHIGLELQLGHVLGNFYDNQVLLIKTAWGGKNLAKDFRPPSSKGEVGPYYTEMIKHVRDVLSDLKKLFPDYDGRGYEIAGFAWHQGWNDGGKQEYIDEYEKNLANLIRDVRKEFAVSDLPFVIANSGFGGWQQKNPRRLGVMKAQAAPAKYPEFKNTVLCVETRDFFRPPEISPSKQGYHWNHNAQTHFLIGNALAEAMIQLYQKNHPSPQNTNTDSN